VKVKQAMLSIRAMELMMPVRFWEAESSIGARRTTQTWRTPPTWRDIQTSRNIRTSKKSIQTFRNIQTSRIMKTKTGIKAGRIIGATTTSCLANAAV